MPEWSFLTNHARVLLAIAADPELRLRQIADAVGITERRVHGIVTDLTDSGYLTKERAGRRNRYAIHTQQPLSQDLSDRGTVGDLVTLLAPRGDDPAGAAS
ncbi:MAG: winged helix-turn-helix domain-containing protein [Actinobacteria bacterium]|nr:winged helix-turn-helix domain-containing protein [Actinomycetota bacterium]